MGLGLRAKGAQPCQWGHDWTDRRAHCPCPHPVTSCPRRLQEPGQSQGGLHVVLTSSGTEQEMRRRVLLGPCLYPPHPLTPFPALSSCPASGSPLPHWGSALAQPTISSAPQARPSPKGFVTEFSGPPQEQMFTLSCTVGDTQYRVTKFPGPRSPSENSGGQSRTRATSCCPDKWREGGAAPAVPGTRCPMQKWPAGQRPGWSRVQAGNENGIVQDTSHLLSQGKKGPLRTQPPAFPQELVASLARTRSPWAHPLAGRAGKPSLHEQRAGTSWKPLVLWPTPRQCGASGAPILTLRSPRGHWGRSAPRLQAEQGSTPPPGSRPGRSQAPGTGRGRKSQSYSPGGIRQQRTGARHRGTGRATIHNGGSWCARVPDQPARCEACSGWRARRLPREHLVSTGAGLFPGSEWRELWEGPGGPWGPSCSHCGPCRPVPQRRVWGAPGD